ncbi:MAG: hypothetical protein Ta2A_08670 [Treponemataceae bacterium]|nr:MAG: hypothetical protein Ta2A_08670 [Treponemataceae bacterium]
MKLKYLFGIFFCVSVFAFSQNADKAGKKDAACAALSFDLLNKTGAPIIELSVRQSFSEIIGDDMLNGTVIPDGAAQPIVFSAGAKKKAGFWDVFCTDVNGAVYIIFGVNFTGGDAPLVTVSADDAAPEAL